VVSQQRMPKSSTISHSRAMKQPHVCRNASLMSKCKPCLCDGAKKSMWVTGRDARHLLHEAPARNLRETASLRLGLNPCLNERSNEALSIMALQI